MEYKPMPVGVWMRLRQHGQTKYAKNESPIVWSAQEPPDGAEVYTVAWRHGQQTLHYKFSQTFKKGNHKQ